MLAHDEVRQRTELRIAVIDEAQREPGARLGLHAHDLGVEPDRVLAGDVEIDLERRALVHDARGAHEQPVARYILDQPVDHHPMHTTLRARPDRDSNSCPLFHVVKATLATYVEKIKSPATP